MTITPSRSFPQIKRDYYNAQVDLMKEDNARLYKEYDHLMSLQNVDLQIALRVATVRATQTIYRQGDTVVYYDGVAGHMASKCFLRDSHAQMYKENMQLRQVIDAGNKVLSNQPSKE